MPLDTLFSPGILSLGIAIGVVLGATGAGGAILSIPLLTLVLHLSVNQAGPIGLLAVTVASAIAALLGFHEGIVRYKAAALMATAGLALSPIGFTLAHHLPNSPLAILFSVVLIGVAVRMWRSPAPAMHEPSATSESIFSCEQSASTGKFIWTLPCARALALTGSLAGFLSGLIGVGGGFIIVPSLKANTNLDMRSVVATSLTVIALVSAGGVAISVHHGALNWSLGMPFTLGTVLGMLAGRYLTKHVAQQTLSRGFSILAFVAAGLMLKEVL